MKSISPLIIKLFCGKDIIHGKIKAVCEKFAVIIELQS